MLAGLIYLTRAASSFVIVAIGLMLLASSASAKKKTAWSIGVPVVIAAAGALAWPRRPNAWKRDPATDRQIAYAKALGIPLRQGMTKGEVSDLISQFKDAE